MIEAPGNLGSRVRIVELVALGRVEVWKNMVMTLITSGPMMVQTAL